MCPAVSPSAAPVPLPNAEPSRGDHAASCSYSATKPSDPWGQRKTSPSVASTSGLRHARAYALSNGLPLAVGTICWGWMETAGTETRAGVLHLALCQVRTRVVLVFYTIARVRC